MGELGKDYVAGEVKSIDPPRLTVLRSDNVRQTLELNEDTSLRKGRESITMADIHPGDHVMIRGASQNNTFVPKNAVVLSPEWLSGVLDAPVRGGAGLSSILIDTGVSSDGSSICSTSRRSNSERTRSRTSPHATASTDS